MAEFYPVIQSSLAKMSEREKLLFTNEYLQRKRSKGLMIFLSIFFPIQLILLDKVGLWFAYILTGGGFGIWWIIEWFLTPGRVDEYNNKIATEIVRNIKIMT